MNKAKRVCRSIASDIKRKSKRNKRPKVNTEYIKRKNNKRRKRMTKKSIEGLIYI